MAVARGGQRPAVVGEELLSWIGSGTERGGGIQEVCKVLALSD